jgi:hypothetical protein
MTIEEVVQDYIRETVKPLTPDQARIKAFRVMWIGQDWHCKPLEISKGNVKNQSLGPKPSRLGQRLKHR